MRANIDIPTFFNRPANIDPDLSQDLSRLGTAVEAVADDPDVLRIPQTAIANGNTTLQPGFVTRLTPPPSGTVVLTLPALADSDENSVAELVITASSSAILSVRAPKGTTINGQASITLTAAPYWYRFIRHGGNWYRG